MADVSVEQMAAMLQPGLYRHAGPTLQSASDPIADTPMMVTLDHVRAYDLNPRVTRNPLYEEIKASIRERGLDAPPPITRRPGEQHFIIRNGGNTRLAILNELWAETRDLRFFHLPCLFRPWSTRGEISCLTGHLAENELHGRLSFIERALGVERAAELYSTEIGEALSQRELARRLTADGYPVTQSYISRMQDAVRLLLPAIPAVLYAGLGKMAISRLISLHAAAAQSWSKHASTRCITVEFSALFHEVLARFDAAVGSFDVQEVQDELVAQMAAQLQVDYYALSLEVADRGIRQSTIALNTAVATVEPEPELTAPANMRASRPHDLQQSPLPSEGSSDEELLTQSLSATPESDHGAATSDTEVSDSAQREERESVEADDQAWPPQQASITSAASQPSELRKEIAELAISIATEAQASQQIEIVQDGLGFVCIALARDRRQLQPAVFERAILTLLNALSGAYTQSTHATFEGLRLADDIALLLLGPTPARHAQLSSARLSDAALNSLVRLIWLARCLLQVESSSAPGPAKHDPR